MLTRIAMASALLLPALQAAALDISGKAQDKFENPLAGVKVCQQGGARCVETGSDGSFRITEATGILRPVDPALAGSSLRVLADHLVYTSPAAGEFRIRWSDARGASLAPSRTARLDAGENRLDPPAGARAAGPAFLRISGPALEVTWKVAMAATGTRPNGLAPASAAPVSGGLAAAKASASAVALELTKDKYLVKVYVPAKESESGVIVVMRPVGDRILFDGKDLSAWGDYSGGAWKVNAEGILYHRGGSGALYTKENYGDFRFVTTSRKPGGGHNPNYLLWCKAGSTDKRTLGGIQFQPPLGHMWDYVTNKDPKSLGTMTRLASTENLKVDQWARCEALAKVSTATIRFACCNLAEGKKSCDAAEIVRFTDTKFARSGPIALMIHDGGQQQDYKDIEVELDPIEPDRLLSVKVR